MTSSSPIESYHTVLKKKGDASFGQEQNIVAKGLQALKRWAQAWKPHYFIVDLRPSRRMPSIARSEGEQEVAVFYCSWHCRQALQRNLGSYGKKRIEDGKPMPDHLTVDCRCQFLCL
jgi:hypothetical protein